MPLAGALLVIGCVAYVAYPIYATRRAHHSTWRRDRLRLELAERKEALYAAIVELEFDRNVGKLPEEDYRWHRQVLEGQALQTLAELGGLDAGGEEAAMRARIDRDVAGRRAQQRGEGAADEPAAAGRCPSCEAVVSARYRFCPECGAPLAEATP